jgi:RNA polymerase sigma-70 factor (ECF subfamily)
MTEVRPGARDDAALVREVAGGSYDALADLYDRHASAIFAVARRLTTDRGVAEEVVQDTFLALWDRAETFDPASGSLAAWLHTIARNRTVDRLRAMGRRPQLVAPPPTTGGEDPETELLERAVRTGSIVAGSAAPIAPELAAVSAETRRTIEVALSEMGVEERTVIVLAYREELTQSEIAERLGWPLGTVKTRTRRALRRLREALELEAAQPVGSSEDG